MPDEPNEALPPQEENPEIASKAAKKQLSPIIVLAGVVVVALVAAFLVSNMVLKPMFSKNNAAVVEKKEEPEKKKEEKKEKKEEKKEEKKSGHGGHGAEEAEPTNILTIDGIVVNPAATGGSRFLSTSIGFEFEESESFNEFKAKEIKIRDALISILSSKTVTELADTKSREIIRRQILKVVNQICQPAQAEAIYFVDFVLQ